MTDIAVEAPLQVVTPEMVGAALTSARGDYPKFRSETEEWMRDNIGLFWLRSRDFYENTITTFGPSRADPGLRGVYLASGILKLGSEQSLISVDLVKENHITNLANYRWIDNGLDFENPIPSGIFTDATTKSLSEVQSKIAQHSCAFCLILGLTTSTEMIDQFNNEKAVV